MSGVEEIQNEPSSNMDLNPDKSEPHRMWAAISFAVMLIVIGIPLWWKTTEVHRASLPYEEIHELDPLSIKISMTIYVYSEYPMRTNSVIERLQFILSDLRAYSVQFKPLKIDVENVTYETIESTQKLHPNHGDLLLIEISDLPNELDAFISNNRIIYYKKETTADLLGAVIRELLHDNFLHYKIISYVSPETLNSNLHETNRLRASLSYDIVFTIINSDPERLQLNWDVESDINKYIQPLFDQIEQISEHHVKSQWLYLIDLGETPKKNGSEWLLSYSQLPHIITPLEKKLGSGISKNPCVHLILYITSCRMAPLRFVSEKGELLNTMISPQWGAVQIFNPTNEHCNENIEIFANNGYNSSDISPDNCSKCGGTVPESKDVMAMFASQFHVLLRVRDELNITKVLINKIQGPLLRSWELDSLYRMRTIEQITTASLTLQSLSKLLGKISNIVINEDVAGAIIEAVTNVNKATDSLNNGKLEQALYFSKLAFSASEKAFSDPSLLALLYFPDDQKYAVYIPLFLPIMIPVLMSLKKIQSWLFSRKWCTVHYKQD